MELNPLRKEEYPEITDAVKEYYRQQGEEASFVESYDNIRVYTKEGRYRGTYVVFAAYDMKIKDIYTKVPGLGTVYAQTDEEADARSALLWRMKKYGPIFRRSRSIRTYSRL